MSTSCMHIRVALVVLITGFLRAQSGVPAFRADRILPSGGHGSVQLVPGMLVSIYGTDLGPQQGCTGRADTHRRETPSPLRPDQAFVNTLIYPKEICGVQVMFGETPAGLLYVQKSQINFKVPQDAPMEGTALLRVVYNGRSSAAVGMRLGLETATLSLEQPARVNRPVWIHIQAPSFPSYGDVQYPVRVQPADSGCHQVEVRRDGVMLPRIPVRTTGGIMLNGPPCGQIAIPGHGARYKNRLPVHLQYRFHKTGVYEVRYTRRRGLPGMSDSQPLFQTAWTQIEILPAQTETPHAPPEDPAEALSDYLPSILGFADATRTSIF